MRLYPQACFPVTKKTDPEHMACKLSIHTIFNLLLLQELSQSMVDNGVQGPFTLGCLDNIPEGFQMVPGDIAHLTHMCLSRA